MVRGAPTDEVAMSQTIQDEVAVSPTIQASPDSSLILPQARGVVGALTRARRDFLIAKQVGVVAIGYEEEVIQRFSDPLLANHPRLVGVP